MNIVLIGNPKINGEKIKEVASQLTDAGINVRYPTVDELDTSADIPIIEMFERIDWCTAALVFPRDGLNMDMSTTTAMAYAKHAKKPVFVYYE